MADEAVPQLQDARDRQYVDDRARKIALSCVGKKCKKCGVNPRHYGSEGGSLYCDDCLLGMDDGVLHAKDCYEHA